MTPNQELVERWEEQLSKFYGAMFECGDFDKLHEFVAHQKALSRAEVLEEIRGKIKQIKVVDSSGIGDLIDKDDTLAVVEELEGVK